MPLQRPHTELLGARVHDSGAENAWRRATVAPGKALDKAYTEKNVPLVEKGLENLVAHVETIKLSGIEPVVCINHFYTDTDEEIAVIRKAAEKAGARVAVSRHWEKGGEGAVELAETVVDVCRTPPKFKFLYELSTPLSERIRLIATKVYGADGVSYTPLAQEKLKAIEADAELAKLGTCMVKTHLSLSHDPTIKGRPRGWTLPIRDILQYRGAGFIVPVAGDVKLMPGTASEPAFRNIDVDVKTREGAGAFLEVAFQLLHGQVSQPRQDLAQLFTGMLFLLRERCFELLFCNDPVVDQRLSQRHEDFLLYRYLLLLVAGGKGLPEPGVPGHPGLPRTSEYA